VAVASAPAVSPAGSTARATGPGWRKWLAIGSGVGIEIGPDDMRATIVKVRPNGFEVLDSLVLSGYKERRATEWGTEYTAFLKRNGMSKRPAVVLLPRAEVIVRHLALPGVADGDMASAISYQIDGMHPYAEDEAAWCWARLPNSSNVVVGITRSEVIERFWSLMVEAGVAVSSFTFSAAAIYGAARIISVPPREFLTIHASDSGVEAYGESVARPVYSGCFEDARGLQSRLLGELRLDPSTGILPAEALLPTPRRAPEMFSLDAQLASVAAAMSAACPRRALKANLLPAERRAQTSRLILVPTAVLALLLVAAAIMVSMQPSWEDRQYLEKLQAEIRTLDRQAAQATTLDREAAAFRARIALLDRFRRRTKADIDALKEITALLPAPGWVHSLQLDRATITLQGEADGAAGLIQVLDKSALFRDSQFSQSMGRVGQSAESFIIRTAREGDGVGIEEGSER
jgi:Tfp pilus assembly protein PilN